MRWRWFSIAGMLFFAVSSFAQSSQQIHSPNPRGKKAHSIPISDKLIQMQVTLDDGETATMLVEEGGLARIGNFKAGWAYALVPVLTGIDDNAASVHIFKLMQDSEGNETIAELEQVQTDTSTAVATKAEPHLQIKLLRVVKPVHAAANATGTSK